MSFGNSSHQWLGRFAVELMRLRGDLTLPTAVDRAVRAYVRWHDSPPEEAARRYAARIARGQEDAHELDNLSQQGIIPQHWISPQ